MDFITSHFGGDFLQNPYFSEIFKVKKRFGYIPNKVIIHNNNNIFAIVQSTVSDLLKDSNPLGLEWEISWVKPQLVYAVANSQNILNHLMIKSIT